MNKNEIIRLRSLNNAIKKNPDVLDKIKQEKDYEKCYSMLESLCNNSNWIEDVLFYSLGFKQAYPLSKLLEQHFKVWDVTEEDFEPFYNYRGLLLEYWKIEKEK